LWIEFVDPAPKESRETVFHKIRFFAKLGAVCSEKAVVTGVLAVWISAKTNRTGGDARRYIDVG
jgi:hypothetical protein